MLIYPISWHRKGEHRPRGPSRTVLPPIPFGRSAEDNRRTCPRCGADGPTAPVRSRYRVPGEVEHDWVCGTCSCTWTTVVDVPS